MGIAVKAVGTYIDTVSSSSVPIPGSPAAGDRMFLFVCNKDYSDTIGVSAGWTPIGSQYADGTVGSGSGSGSMSVHAWYRDWESGDPNPTVSQTPNSSDGGAAVILLLEKSFADTWADPLTTNAAWTLNTAATPQTVSAIGTLAVPDGAAVMAFLGIRDDVATLTRPTDGIGVSSGITWDGDYVEAPATHHSSASGADSAADLGYRMVTTGGTVTLQLTATLGTAETGAIQFVVQGVTAPPVLVESQTLRPIAGLEEDVGTPKWAYIDDVVTQPAAGDGVYAEYTGSGDVSYDEKFQVQQPDPGYTILGATLWILAHTEVAGTIRIEQIRIKLNGTWYDLGVVDDYLTTSPVWYSYALSGISESSDSADIGFEVKLHDENWAGDKALIDVAYLELTYPDLSQSSGFFHWF